MNRMAVKTGFIELIFYGRTKDRAKWGPCSVFPVGKNISSSPHFIRCRI
jgi:hypothetical protein